MSKEITAVKAGGTSNAHPEAIGKSLSWAEISDIYVASAPGALPEVEGDYGKKVSILLKEAWRKYDGTGEVPRNIGRIIMERYDYVISGLEHPHKAYGILDGLRPRYEEAVKNGEDSAFRFGERIQAEIVATQGYRLIDPTTAPHDLGYKRQFARDNWRNWLSAEYRPGEKHVLMGNVTKVNGAPISFSVGGSDTSMGYGAYGIQADIAYNLTNNGAMSGDPEKMPDVVRPIEHMLYEEGRALGKNGTGLLHPAAMVPLMKGNIPTIIRSTFESEAPYTVVDNDVERARHRAGRVLAVSLMENVVTLRIRDDGMADDEGVVAEYETAIAEKGIPLIDSVGHGTDAQKYPVHAEHADKVREVLEGFVGEEYVESSPRMSYVTMVGYRIEERFVDNIVQITMSHPSLDIDARTRDGLPEPNSGRHSLRLAVHNDEGEQIAKDMHSTFIESRAA